MGRKSTSALPKKTKSLLKSSLKNYIDQFHGFHMALDKLYVENEAELAKYSIDSSGWSESCRTRMAKILENMAYNKKVLSQICESLPKWTIINESNNVPQSVQQDNGRPKKTRQRNKKNLGVST